MKYFFLFTLLLFITSNVISSEFENTLKLAQEGFPIPQYYMGLRYDDGDGVPKNDTEALN
jgi:TPR repeat protein